MGDYYKYKKILVILMIVSCGFSIIKNIFKTNVQAATNVNESYTNGNYTQYGSDSFSAIRNDYIQLQDDIIDYCYYLYNNGYKDNVKNFLNTYKIYIFGINTSYDLYWVRGASSSIPFGLQLYNKYSYNITITSANLANGYYIESCPFDVVTRSNSLYFRRLSNYLTTNSTVTTGNINIPMACRGALSSRWVDLFSYCDIFSSTSEYEAALNTIQSTLESIETTNEENYTQLYYTKQAVQNTYNYLTNDTIEQVTSLGISQPQVTEQVDLTDVLDSLEALLTNETYTTKFFTITLPNGRGSTFALSPELLENNLNRVGGQNIVSIIHAVWYIGLYGWYIFSLLGIYGKLLTGDLFHLVKGCSPVTNLVKMSVGTISGGKF